MKFILKISICTSLLILFVFFKVKIIILLILFIFSTIFSFLCFLNSQLVVTPQSSHPTRPGLDFILKKMSSKKEPRLVDYNITGHGEVDQILQNVPAGLTADNPAFYAGLCLLLVQQDQSRAGFSGHREDGHPGVHFQSGRVCPAGQLDRVLHSESGRRVGDPPSIVGMVRDGSPPDTQKLEGVFFDLEAKMKGMSRERICLSPKVEKSRVGDTAEYLECLSEMVIFEVFPLGVCQCVSVRCLLRVFLWLSADHPGGEGAAAPNGEAERPRLHQPEYQLAVAQLPDQQGKLHQRREERHRHGGNGGPHPAAERGDRQVRLEGQRGERRLSPDDAVAEVKQTLSSLKYLKYLCLNRLEFLSKHLNVSEDVLDDSQLREYLSNPSLYNMSFDEMMDSCVALTNFSNYLSEFEMNHYIHFYSNCLNFVATLQQLKHCQEDGQADMNKNICRMARSIYDNYLSPLADFPIVIDQSSLGAIEDDLNASQVTEDLFKLACNHVRTQLQRSYFDGFKQTTHYAAALLDLGLIGGSTDSGAKEEEEEVVTVCAYIYDSETVPEGMTTHRIYKIDCNETFHSSGRIVCRDEIFRRYVHFAKFHKFLREKVDQSFLPELPQKKLLITNEEDYKDLEVKLNIYLKSLCNPSLQNMERRIYFLLNEFLQPCPFSVCEAALLRKYSELKSLPRKSIMSSVFGGFVRTLTPRQNNSHSFKIISDAEAKLSEMPPDATDSGYKFEQDDDNIPLRIILLFADELFDLKTENRWIRRRMVVLFREVIRATYGDTINKKIVDQMRWLVCREQVVVYLKAFRDSFWPGGVLSDEVPVRDSATKMRTRVVTRCKLLSAIPDEVKTLVGQHTAKRGVTHVFNMFQIPILNRRLAYVLIERLVYCLFQNQEMINSLNNFHSKN